MFKLKKIFFLLSLLIISLSFSGCEKKKTTFEEAFPFNNDVAWVKNQGLYGLINKKGEFIIPPTYEEAQSSLNDLMIVKANDKYGAINSRNEEIIPFIYDSLFFNTNKYLTVIKDGKHGVIDTTGTTIIEAKYPAPIYLYSFIKEDKEEEVIAFITDEIGNQGLINLTTGFTLEPAYQGLTPYTYQNDNIITFTGNSKHGFINLETEKVIEPFSNQTIVFEDGITLIYVDGKYGYMNTNGEVLIAPAYDHAYAFSEGLAFVRTNDKYGCINLQGEMVLQPIYDLPSSFNNGIAKVNLDGKQCFIDTSGQVMNVKPEDYYELYSKNYFNNINSTVKFAHYEAKNGAKKALVLDSNNNILFKTNYDYITPLSNEFYNVSLNGKTGCINTNGIEVLPPAYDFIHPLDNNLFLVSKLKKCGVLDSMRNEVIPLDYIEIRPTDKDIFFVKTSTKWGTYNIKSKEVKPDLYDEVMTQWEFPAAVRQGEEWFYIDENGEILF